jgi:hypothetical protein
MKQALDTKAISKVQAEIKRQVRIYMLAAKNEPVAGEPSDFWCGSGRIGFDLSNVKAELTTTIETINSGGLKLKIPIRAVEVDPSGSLKTDVTNTQTLDYNLWPLSANQQELANSKPSDDEINKAPIAKVLLSLREVLINSARKSQNLEPQPCFTDYNPDKPSADAGNTFKLALSFVNDVTGGFELSIGVLDLTASTESKGTTGNTLTVSFVQHGMKEVQVLRDEVDAECKFPDYAKKPMCVVARKALSLITEPSDRILSGEKELKGAVETICKVTPPAKDPPPDCAKAERLQKISLAMIGNGESFM